MHATIHLILSYYGNNNNDNNNNKKCGTVGWQWPQDHLLTQGSSILIQTRVTDNILFENIKL